MMVHACANSALPVKILLMIVSCLEVPGITQTFQGEKRTLQYALLLVYYKIDQYRKKDLGAFSYSSFTHFGILCSCECSNEEDIHTGQQFL